VGEVTGDYRFEMENGLVRQADLSGDYATLIVYSYMFGPQRERPCPMCTSLLGSWEKTSSSAWFWPWWRAHPATGYELPSRHAARLDHRPGAAAQPGERDLRHAVPGLVRNLLDRRHDVVRALPFRQELLHHVGREPPVPEGSAPVYLPVRRPVESGDQGVTPMFSTLAMGVSSRSSRSPGPTWRFPRAGP